MADLEELYREIILDHYRSPRNRGELPTPPAVRTEGFNPLCGQGCSISQSSASMMSAAVKGKSVAETRKTIDTFKTLMSVHEAQLEESEGTPEPEPVDLNALGELAALQGVVKFPVRIKCATLSWNTLAQALEEAGA